MLTNKYINARTKGREPEMRIALAGNPNSGKTTMYNALTGRNEHVGNWAGVTVGRKEASFRPEYGRGLTAVDLPGAYSMSPFTPEESITSSYVRDENPDAIINIVDATNLSRSLFFTTQLLELGIPVVVALNKSDVCEDEGITIDEVLLSERLGCPVIKTVSTDRSDEGLRSLAEAAADAARTAGGAEAAEGCALKHVTEPPFVQRDINIHDKEQVDSEDRRRFAFVDELVRDVEIRAVSTSAHGIQDRIDSVVTNPIGGIAIFALVMWAVFKISQSWLGPAIADWMTGYINIAQGLVSDALADSPAILSAILADGVIGGVGAVVGFLPLVMIMYFLIALLEDCGYMARVSVVMDPIFKRVGLSGRSIIPVIISTGCAIPGIMATRTIRDERERRATAMLAPFIPCGAKIPVIALFAGVFFGGAGWVSTLMYFMGILLIFLGALLVKAVTGNKYRKSFFIIELPRYKVPSLKRAAVSMLERGKAYIVKAATIILVCNCAVQVMQSFTWSFEPVAEGMADTSILASIARPVAILLIPLGFGAWQLAAAAVTGFIAKENVVGTLAVVYSVTSFIDTEELALTGGAGSVAAAMGLTSVTAMAYLMFNLFTPPCFAAMGAMNSELGSKGWLACAIGLQFGTGYTIAFLVNQIGTLVTAGHLAVGFAPGLVAIIAMTAIIVCIGKKIRREFDAKYELHRMEASCKTI